MSHVLQFIAVVPMHTVQTYKVKIRDLHISYFINNTNSITHCIIILVSNCVVNLSQLFINTVVPYMVVSCIPTSFVEVSLRLQCGIAQYYQV